MAQASATYRKTAGLAAVFLTALTLSFVFITGTSDKACAQPIADTPCDTVYYDSLEARAWLEAQREITQNQNLIFKPDSVLEYTCFDRFANVLALQAFTMFSETTRWGDILPDDSMDNALDTLVGEAMRDYLTANFDHDFLGGRWEDEDYEPADEIAGGTYSCDMMNRVWAYAKCMDFAQNPDTDGFFTFASYAEDDDKRQLPTACANLGATWETNITTAGLDPDTSPEWVPDNPRTYLDWMDPANCGDDDYPPIDTGITVSRPRSEPNQYVERVCVIPGCHYVPPDAGGTAAGECRP